MKKVVFLLVISVVLLTGCSVKKTEDISGAEKFAAEYSVNKDNPFEYISIEEVLEIFKGGSGIVFFGNSDCEWCLETAKILNQAVVYKNIDKVYYYNPKDIREKDSSEYKELIKLLGDNLEKNEQGEAYLYLPDVYFVKNGKIIGHNNDTATMSGTVDEALSDENKKELKNKYLDLISEYNVKECSDKC